MEKIPNKADQNIYVVYTDYELYSGPALDPGNVQSQGHSGGFLPLLRK
jgi:hypothetical protein